MISSRSMRVRARTALSIGVPLLLLLFLLARRLGDDDRTTPHAGPNTASGRELPDDRPPVDGESPEHRSLVPDWNAAPEAKAADDVHATPEVPPPPADPGVLPTDVAEGSRTETALGGDAQRFGEGHLEGRVTYSGAVPDPIPLDLSRDPKCKALAEPEDQVRRLVQVDGKGGLAGAVVWVEPAAPLEYPVPQEKVIVHQTHCRFRPDVVAIQIGQTLEVRNDDPLLHEVHGVAKRSEFNMAMPAQGMKIERRFKAEDHDGTLLCEIHPWMEGRLFVFSHPFFAITDVSGRFSIDRLPGDGPWHVLVRHPYAGARELSVLPGPLEVHLTAPEL